MKLSGIKVLSGKIRLRSGLHIGAGGAEMHIGGMDNPVIKHPHTDEPYIPGSSIKGKVRSLLEMKEGLSAFTEPMGAVVSPKILERRDVAGNAVLRDAAMAILKIFGSSGAEADTTGEIGPTRVSFGDCHIDPAWLARAKSLHYGLTEEKSENSINRISGTAQNPRITERVPEGTMFAFSVSFKLLMDGDEQLFEKYLLAGIKLLELDALGGSGSRGYGRVKLMDLTLDGQPYQDTFDAVSPF